MPKEEEKEAEAQEADAYDADDQPEGEQHISQVDALLLAPRSDQSARKLIIDDEQ